MIDSTTLHLRSVREANAAIAAHVPSVTSTLPGGCVCYKCEDVRGLRAAHRACVLTSNEHGVWCEFHADWLAWYVA